MKKRTNALLSILLAFLMVFALASCAASTDTGGNGGGSSPTPTADPGSNPSETVEPTEEVELTPAEIAAQKNAYFDKYPAKDLGGRTIVASAHYSFFPDTVSGTFVEPDPSDENYYQNMANYLNILRVMEKYNVQFEERVLGWNETPTTLITSALAGAPEFDIVGLDGQHISGPIANNLLQPLSDVAKSYTDIASEQYYFRPLGAYFGVEYFFPDYVMGRDEDGNPILDFEGVCIGYNKDILTAAGLEDPRELYDAGNWTWDKFLEMCREVTKNNTESNTIWGYTGTVVNTANSFIATNGGYLLDEANAKPGLDDPKTIKALELLNTMFNVDKIYGLPEGGIHDWGGMWDQYAQGKSAFFEFRPWVLQGDEFDFQFGLVPYPKGPDGDGTKSWFRGTGRNAIVSGIDDGDIVYQIYEELKIPYYTEDTVDLYENPYSYPESVLQNETDVLLFADICLNGFATDNATYIAGMTDALSGVIVPIALGEMTVAQSIEANKQIVQDKIDAVVNP